MQISVSQVLILRGQRAKSTDLFLNAYITSEVAASLIGCTRRALLHWVAQGWIEAASGPGIDNARIYRFDKQAVLRWRQERLVSSEARDLLGIKQRTMEAWIAKGRLKPLENMGQHPHWFAKEDILRIKETRKVTAEPPNL
jgi:DNA-binding transcriptional MerR regulator